MKRTPLLLPGLLVMNFLHAPHSSNTDARIAPDFSDANWISMGGIPGVHGTVRAAVVDASDNLSYPEHFRLN